MSSCPPAANSNTYRDPNPCPNRHGEPTIPISRNDAAHDDAEDNARNLESPERSPRFRRRSLVMHFQFPLRDLARHTSTLRVSNRRTGEVMQDPVRGIPTAFITLSLERSSVIVNDMSRFGHSTV